MCRTMKGGKCVPIYRIGVVGRLARNYMSQQPKEMVPPQQNNKIPLVHATPALWQKIGLFK